MMVEQIKVSIITVCLNSEKTIKTTMESVLNQSYKNYEYIIVDGGSTDNTLKIIDEYSALFGNRIHLISEKDYGIYDAMNKGIKRANGQVIGIINSDDYYERDALEIMVQNLKSSRYQILYGMMRLIEEEQEKAILLYSHNFLREKMICHPACFITKAVYEDFGYYDIQYISAADYEFMLRMIKNREIIFVPVYSIISNFRSGGMCDSLKGRLDSFRVRKKYRLISKSEYIKCYIKTKFLHR